MGTRKQELMQFFDDCINYEGEDGYSNITVFIKMPDLSDLEKITNSRVNWKTKKAYYERAYNDDLALITNPLIIIVSWVGV